MPSMQREGEREHTLPIAPIQGTCIHTHTQARILAGAHLGAVGARDGDPVSWTAQVHVALVHVHGHVVGRLALRDIIGLLLHQCARGCTCIMHACT